MWFGDGSVILDFDGKRVEVCHREFDKVSATWNTIRISDPLESSYFKLSLRSEGPSELERLVGQTLESVELLEWEKPDANQGNTAIHLVFHDGLLTIHNLIDSTAMAFDIPAPEYRVHRLQRG